VARCNAQLLVNVSLNQLVLQLIDEVGALHNVICKEKLLHVGN